MDTTGEAASYDPGDTVPTAIVWKTIADPFAGRLTLFRVASGALKAYSAIHNVNTDAHERIGTVTLMQGKTQESIGEIRAGDLGAVAKLKDTRTGDTLANRDSAWRFAPFRFTDPVLSYAIEPMSMATRKRSAPRFTGWRRRIRRFAIPAIRRRDSCCCQGRANCISK